MAQLREAPGTSGKGEHSDNPIAKLECLRKLRDSGVLTGAEFEQQKQRLLGSS